MVTQEFFKSGELRWICPFKNMHRDFKPLLYMKVSWDSGRHQIQTLPGNQKWVHCQTN